MGVRVYSLIILGWLPLVAWSATERIRLQLRVVGSDTVARPPYQFGYRQTHLQFHFWNETDAAKRDFEYQLQGFDKGWIRCQDCQQVTYANLFGGNYVFKLKPLHGSDSQMVSLIFKIDQAFWQRWWFIPTVAAYLLLMGGIVGYFFYLFRLQQKLRVEKLRNDLAADLHDDIGATLGSISFFGEIAKSKLLKQRPDEALPIVERMIENAQEMVQTMRGMIWTIHPQSDHVAGFFDKVKQFAEAVLATRQVEVVFETTGLENGSLSPELQRNLFLIGKEITHNIAKHAHATRVVYAITLTTHQLTITVTDNGCGFDTNQPNEGNGLRNLQNRAQQIGGVLQIESAVGAGTRVVLVCDW